MHSLHKMKSPRNQVIAMVMILAVPIFALSLPHPPSIQADVKARKASLNRESRLAIQSKTIEQKVFDQTVARLRIDPGRSPGESEFAVERMQRRQTVEVLATGRLQVSDNRVRVIIHEARYDDRLSLESHVDPETPSLVLNTLSFNGALYTFAFDVEKARRLSGKMRDLLAERKQEEANQLAVHITKMLAPDDRYVNFTAQVRSSSAFDALATTASLLAMAPPEETHGDFTVLAITYATKILAPSAWLAAKAGRTTGMVRQPKPQIAKIGFHRTVPTYHWRPSRSSQVVFCCAFCVGLAAAGIYGCVEMYVWCDANLGSPWCEIFFAACVAGDIALVIECIENCEEC